MGGKMDYKAIGNRIRKKRKERKLSQEQLAEQIDISPTHMSHIETGATKLSLSVLVEIAKTLEVSCDSLLFDENTASAAEIEKLFSECDEKQVNVITAIVKTAKEALEIYKNKGQT